MVDFAGEDVLVGRTDDEVVDDRVVDEPAEQDDGDRDPAEGQQIAQPRSPAVAARGRRTADCSLPCEGRDAPSASAISLQPLDACLTLSMTCSGVIDAAGQRLQAREPGSGDARRSSRCRARASGRRPT